MSLFARFIEFLKSQSLNKVFVSDLDHFLQELRQRTGLSRSQQQEKNKAEQIAKLRDDPTAKVSKDFI